MVLLVEGRAVSLKGDDDDGVALETLDGGGVIACGVIVCEVRVSGRYWQMEEAEERSDPDVHDVAEKMDVKWTCREVTMHFRLD
jgi:hypothetical protein